MADKEVKEAAKEIVQREQDIDEIHVLSTGIRVKLSSVSGTLIDDLRAAIEDPPIPVVYIDEKSREEENPNDPAYLAAVEEANRRRGVAMLDAIMIFGMELVDGMPKDDVWSRSSRHWPSTRVLT